MAPFTVDFIEDEAERSESLVVKEKNTTGSPEEHKKSALKQTPLAN